MPATASQDTCPNCGAPLRGEYCANCGQHCVDLDVPLRKFLGEFLHESLSLDSSIVRTLKPLVFKPGFLTVEYLAGRRARYVPPIRLFLVMSFSLFLLLAWTSKASVNGEPGSGPVNFTITESTPSDAEPVGLPAGTAGESASEPGDSVTGGAGAAIERRMANRFAQAMENPDQFVQTFLDRLAQIVFLLLPAFAMLLKALYRRRPYVHHLLFSVYFHAFTFAVMIVGTLLELVRLPVIPDAVILAVPIYLLVGMRRVYGQSWPRTLLKWGTLGVAHMSVLIATLGLTFALTLFFI